MTPTYPKYPPYDQGPHLEEQAIERFRGKVVGGRRFLAEPWTPAYNQGFRFTSSNFTEPAFTISTHDDAPGFADPMIRHFAAGGNGGGEPIPLVCETPPPGFYVPPRYRVHTVAFSGSDTHPLRRELIEACFDEALDGPVSLKPWSPTVDEATISATCADLRTARFALCPRGYGPTSYRLYEALRCGVVPVYVSDRHWLPWPHLIDWQAIAVIETDPVVAARRIKTMTNAEWWDRSERARKLGEWMTPKAVLDVIEAELMRNPV